VVLHPISSPHSEKTVAAVAALDSAAHSNLKALGETMKPLEEKLFQRLRSNPKTAQQFLLDPLGTMEALGLIDSAMRTVIDGHRAALAGVFAPKQ
jgi:hypothetical protein